MFRIHFIQNLRQIIIAILISTFVLGLARVTFLFNITNVNELLQYTQDFWLSTVVGLRFDLKVSVIAFMPLFLLGCISANDERWQRRYDSISQY